MNNNNLSLGRLIRHIDPGGCPHCNGIVKVVESEMNELRIGKNGNPISVEGISYKCVGYCTSCYQPLYIDPTNGYYRAFPFTECSIKLNNALRRVFGEDRGSVLTSSQLTPVTDIDSEFVKK